MAESPSCSTETRDDVKLEYLSTEESNTQAKSVLYGISLTRTGTELLFFSFCAVKCGLVTQVQFQMAAIKWSAVRYYIRKCCLARKTHEDVKEKWMLSPTHSGS
jgi:hypothetical protein